MKLLFWLPAILVDMGKLLLPKWLFVLLYKPSGWNRKQAEISLRNAERYAAYLAKRSAQ